MYSYSIRIFFCFYIHLYINGVQFHEIQFVNEYIESYFSLDTLFDRGK